MVTLDRTRQAAPQIAERLRAKILSLELPPRTVLSRPSLQAEFGVSQTPVRDALQQLAEEGLVLIYPQSSTLVSPIDLDQALQAHFLRASIELEAVAKIAAAPSPELIANLEAIVARQKRHSKAGTFEAFDDEDRLYHKALYDAVEVPLLWAIVRRHAVHIDRLRRLNLPRPGKMASVLAGHIAILDAIRAADPDGAVAALRAHLSGTVALIATMAEENPGYVTKA